MSNYLSDLNQANKFYQQKKYLEALHLYRNISIFEHSLLDNVHLNIYFCLKNLDFFSSENLPRVIVYTCNFGDYESVKEPVFQDPTVEYILFTNNKNLKSEKWKIQVLDDADITVLSQRRQSRLPKILAHKYLPEHDFSLYIDSSLQLKTADIRYLIDQGLKEKEIALYPHYKRNCVYDEINYVRASNHNDRSESDIICDASIKSYQELNYPKNNGLYENAFIIRKNSETIRKLNEIWWSYYISDSERDQFTFMKAIYTTKTLVEKIEFGIEFRKSPFVNFYRHNTNIIRNKKIAIVVHCFYMDVWDNIYHRLNQLNTQNFDLFITGQPNIINSIKTKIKDRANVFYLECENLGMDLLPFLTAIKHYNLHEYDAVLKLQTKNIKTLERKVQGDMIFDALINNDVFRFLDKYSASNHWSAIYPGLYARSLEALMYLNAEKVHTLNNILGLKFDETTTFSAGTMFWIKGSCLLPLARSFYTIEKMFIDAQEQVVTGGDGSLAHALERVFGCLSKESDKLFSFRIGLNNPSFKMYQRTEVPYFFNSVLVSDSTALVDHYMNVGVAHQLSRSSIFDERYYVSEISRMDSSKVEFVKSSPASHAILYAEMMHEIDISTKFSMSFYKLENPDIIRRGKSILAHFLSRGHREGRQIFPTYQKVYKIFENDNILLQFDSDKRILNKIKENKTSDKLLSLEEYKILKPTFIDILKQKDWNKLVLKEFEHATYNYANNYAKAFFEKYPHLRNATEFYAFSELLVGNFSNALNIYNIFWNKLLSSEFAKKSHLSKFNYIQKKVLNQNDKVFQNVEAIPKNLIKNIDKKICIYTSLYGARDILPKINTKFPEVDFICFSDREHIGSDWKVIVVPPEFENDNLNAKRFKILPHKYLMGYDASLFVDANTFFYGNLDELIKCYLLPESFVMWKHPERSDVLWEVAAIIASKRHRPTEVIKQLEIYKGFGIPEDTGIVEGSFIWRVHNNTVLNTFMEEWWEHIIQYSKRDQLSLAFLMWKNNFRPKVLPNYLGNPRKNLYFSKFSHADEIEDVSNTLDRFNAIDNIVFLYDSKAKNAGSTVMRGFQLYDIVKQHLPNKCSKKLNIKITDEYENIENSIIFATKGFISAVTKETLIKLKNHGNIICADYVDAKVNNDHVEYIDVLIAASITAFIDYNTRFPHKKIHLLTHHVDPRIEHLRGTITQPKNKIAYFGERVNTKVTEDSLKYIDMHQVDTSGKDMEHTWIKQVPNYQYHYAVRNRRGIDGHKPFTKGFTAACVGAKLILEREVDDAMFYLGYHYPYFIDYNEKSLAETLDHIIHKQTSNRDVDAKLAETYITALRERSTPEFITDEFAKMIANFIK